MANHQAAQAAPAAPAAAGGGRRRVAVGAVTGLAVVVILAVSAHGLADSRRFADLSGDADEYRRLAAQLAVHGVLSDQPLGASPGAPSASREPIYPLFLAAVATAVRFASPATTAVEAAAGLDGGAAESAAVAVQWTLLIGTAALAGWSVRQRSGSVAFGLLVAFAVASSPALLESAVSLGTEALAVPLALAAGWTLERAVRTPGAGRTALAAVAWSLLVLTRLGTLPLIALAAGLLAWGAPRGGRARAVALFLVLALLPTLLWVGRNRAQLGTFSLDEGRAAFNLQVRVELDRLLEGEGIPAAFFAWAPPPSWRTIALTRYPGAAVLSGSMRDARHYHRSAQRVWRQAVERTGSRAAAAGEVRAAAVRELAFRPLRHLRTSGLVAWRGLFVEAGLPAWRSPAAALWVGPLLLLAGGVGALRALRRQDRPLLALLLLPLAGFLLHAAWTEFRPRFQLPALPLLWMTCGLLAAELWGRLRPARRGDEAAATATETGSEKLD